MNKRSSRLIDWTNFLIIELVCNIKIVSGSSIDKSFIILSSIDLSPLVEKLYNDCTISTILNANSFRYFVRFDNSFFGSFFGVGCDNAFDGNI
jgi:hypothetical protein